MSSVAWETGVEMRRLRVVVRNILAAGAGRWFGNGPAAAVALRAWAPKEAGHYAPRGLKPAPLLHIPGWRMAQHRLVGIERVFDFPIRDSSSSSVGCGGAGGGGGVRARLGRRLARGWPEALSRTLAKGGRRREQMALSGGTPHAPAVDYGVGRPKAMMSVPTPRQRAAGCRRRTSSATPSTPDWSESSRARHPCARRRPRAAPLSSQKNTTFLAVLRAPPHESTLPDCGTCHATLPVWMSSAAGCAGPVRAPGRTCHP